MFKSSPKIFDNYKSDFPENTIKRISSGFRKIGLDVFYKPHYETQVASRIQSGSVYIADTEISTNGKGTSPILSEASAWAEMAERFSSTFSLRALGHTGPTFIFGEKSLFWDLFERYPAIYRSFKHRNFLRGYVYEEKAEKFDSPSLMDFYPFSSEDIALFSERDVLQHWVDAYSLIEERAVKIPPKLIDVLSGSNGLASGNTLEEAFVQAMMEVFERHAIFSIFRSQLPCPTVDPRTIDDEEIQHYIALFKSLNIDVIIKDFSLGGKVPVVGVIFENKNVAHDANMLKRTYCHRIIRAGAHFSRVEAVKRCFTEGTQGHSLEEFQFHRRLDPLWHFLHDCMGKSLKKPMHPFWTMFTCGDYAGEMAFLNQNASAIRFEDLIDIRHGDFIDDIDDIASLCRKNGWKVYAIDYTHSRLGFPTVRVVVPPISYMLFHQFPNSPIRDQFPPIGGTHVLGMKVPRGWSPTRDEVAEWRDKFEEFVSMFPIQHSSISWTFYTNLSAFRVLSVANLILGDFTQARCYADFLKELNRDLDIVELVESFSDKSEAPPPALMQKALLNDCECVGCQIRFPKTIHKMVASFYESHDEREALERQQRLAVKTEPNSGRAMP
jgi:ribosomal protein S12 methylthiotransferase accessory factor